MMGYDEYQDPPEEDLIAELVAHLNKTLLNKGDCEPWCGHCYAEWEIRQRGIEDVNLEDDYYVREELLRQTGQDEEEAVR